jgi:8-oxo-dGTP pyrophosphatase MutT (NUDIX family)
MERIQLKAASYLFLIRDNKILLSRRYNTTWNDGNYSVPAGHIEADETFTQAMTREAFEEIDIVLQKENLEVVHVMHRLPVSYVDIFFVADNYQGEIKNKEPNKCDNLEWFPLDGLPPNMVLSVKSAIEHYIKGEKYSEFLIKE